MSKKSKQKNSNFKAVPARKTPAPTTVVRNTPVPRAAAKPVVTHEMIAKRAYEIYRSPRNRSQVENWLLAERELKG
ncbi:MAG TPA: DUF2934 domain-containing protein [Tepidisphaeraceae bacterium]